jgi:hypothetical protein
MLSISFYKPVEYFSNFFNRFVTWMTAGDFCHCELVIHTTPTDIMNTVKKIYKNAQENTYAPEDCARILQQIESNFFSTEFRKSMQSTDSIVIAFSQLWGAPSTVRVLNKVSHDSWLKIPDESTADTIEMRTINNITSEQLNETLHFSIEELGKNYDSSGALCSWVPWTSEEPKREYESYFCSEFVVTAFQRIGHLTKLKPLHTTPNALFKYIDNYQNGV